VTNSIAQAAGAKRIYDLLQGLSGAHEHLDNLAAASTRTSFVQMIGTVKKMVVRAVHPQSACSYANLPLGPRLILAKSKAMYLAKHLGHDIESAQVFWKKRR
jgi:hypothetical protein